jgi:hypothetical protein
MSTAARDLAERLLDAQIDYLVTELTGDQLPALVAHVVDDVLDIAGNLVLGDVVDPQRVKAAARHVADRAVGSPLVTDLVEQFAEALYGMPASDEHELGSVVDRERVAALVDKLLSMRVLRDRALDRLAESPAVSVVATKFVSKIIADFVAQNRAMAQKVPGMSSLLSLGTSAASVVRNPLDQFLGDAAERSAQYAMRRTNSAAREVFDEAPLREAAMEVWDLHAQEPVGALRAYLEEQDLRELASLISDLVLDARGSAFFGEVLDACVDVVFARYGEWDLASLVREVGIERDELVAHLVALGGPLLDAAERDGQLRQVLRARLAPFFHSPNVAALLAEAQPTETAPDLG